MQNMMVFGIFKQLLAKKIIPGETETRNVCSRVSRKKKQVTVVRVFFFLLASVINYHVNRSKISRTFKKFLCIVNSASVLYRIVMESFC